MLAVSFKLEYIRVRNASLQQVIGTGSMRQGRVVDWRSILCHRGTNVPLLHGLTLSIVSSLTPRLLQFLVMNEENNFNKIGII